MKRLTLIACLLAGCYSHCVFAQHWTSQEQEVINTVKKGWLLWDESVEKNDLSIWVDGFKPMDDFVGWWTATGAPWGMDDMEIFEKVYLKNVKASALERLDPIAMRIYGDTALIYYYVIFQSQANDGKWTRFEEKRLEVFVQKGGTWRWAGCMATGDDVVALN